MTTSGGEGNAQSGPGSASARPCAAASSGPAYWRSLEDHAQSPELRAWAGREFAGTAGAEGEAPAEPSRRRFLQVMAATLALAGGLTGTNGCRRPEARIRPYNKKPVDVVIGQRMYYATSMVVAGRVIGLLAETHEGRPTKIEGNPEHPSSLGGTDAFAQASVLDLYDPDRSRSFLHNGQVVGRDAFFAFLDQHAAELKASGGQGLAVLSEDYASPAMDLLRRHATQALPRATFHVYEPLPLGAGPFGPFYCDLTHAQVILCLDSDLLGLEDEGVRYRRQFADHRQVLRPEDADKMNRLYVVEPHFTTTGAAADHRLRLPASLVPAYTLALAAALGVSSEPAPQLPTAVVDPKWVSAVAADLKAHAGGRCVIVAGSRQPSAVHQLVALMNQALGNVGQTMFYPASEPGQPPSGDGSTPLLPIAQLVHRAQQGEVRTLLILGGNPAYNAPADLDLPALLKQIPTSIRLGYYEDETSALSTWHVPAVHCLESWGDARMPDGTVSAIQPMIEPLFGGVSPLELLARLSSYDKRDPYEIVRRSFGALIGDGGDFEQRWARWVQGEPLRRDAAAAGGSGLRSGVAVRVEAAVPQLSASNLEVCFAADASVLDGRFANNGWLQECPDPMTRLTWDNAAILSPATARELGVQSKWQGGKVYADVVRIELDGRTLELPVFVMPGHADYSVTLPLGYGRTQAGSLGTGRGADAYKLRTTGTMGWATGAKVTRTGRTYILATTQEHYSYADHHLGEGDDAAAERAIIREGTAQQFQQDPGFAGRMGEQPESKLSIYSPPKLTGPNQWGLAVDLTACIGCGACVVACQAENNIPTVGKDEVLHGRAMHWMRIDRYFAGEDPEGAVQATVQPMMCQHCENAPCEPVCPVNATTHSSEGLNQMVYNRCIGTRYCSNNCPYKVRRFNFFDYNKGTLRQTPNLSSFDGDPQPSPTQGFSQPQVLQPAMQELLKMQKNPEVTVRMRGVMEKCTYCVQRIEAARIQVHAATGQSAAPNRVEGQPAVKVADGAVQTACQQVCPTQAIVFGDISDPSSRVSLVRNSQRRYAVLEHLNVRPRTVYLARLRNVNPELEPRKAALPMAGEGVHG